VRVLGGLQHHLGKINSNADIEGLRILIRVPAGKPQRACVAHPADGAGADRRQVNEDLIRAAKRPVCACWYRASSTRTSKRARRLLERQDHRRSVKDHAPSPAAQAAREFAAQLLLAAEMIEQAPRPTGRGAHRGAGLQKRSGQAATYGGGRILKILDARTDTVRSAEVEVRRAESQKSSDTTKKMSGASEAKRPPRPKSATTMPTARNAQELDAAVPDQGRQVDDGAADRPRGRRAARALAAALSRDRRRACARTQTGEASERLRELIASVDPRYAEQALLDAQAAPTAATRGKVQAQRRAVEAVINQSLTPASCKPDRDVNEISATNKVTAIACSSIRRTSWRSPTSNHRQVEQGSAEKDFQLFFAASTWW